MILALLEPRRGVLDGLPGLAFRFEPTTYARAQLARELAWRREPR